MMISYDDLRLYTYSNDKLIQGEIKGIVIEFTGLNGNRMINEDTANGLYFAEKGIAYLFPYINPWAWMNRQAVALADAVIDALIAGRGLREDIPIVCAGGSMGGQCSLVYAYYAKRTPVACSANCPVCDMPFHYTERPDLPRTMLSAFGEYGMPLQDAIKTASPLHLAEKMPDIFYYIVHCEEDKAVNKQAHSDKLVAVLKQTHKVIYRSVPGRGHCDLTDEAREEYLNYIAERILNHEA